MGYLPNASKSGTRAPVHLHDDRPDDGTHLLAGCLFALPIGLAMWAGLIALVWRAVG